jgi:hypothetical protein
MNKTACPDSWWILIFVLTLLTGGPGGAWAAVIHVPGDVPSIQEGIDAAEDGDTVALADGIFRGPGNKKVNFRGKAITVRSANGPLKCIVDCEHDGNGFVFESNEGSNSVLDGLTIMNGQALYGGGIRIKESSPTVTNCIFLRNEGKRKGGIDGYGGAIYCSDDIVVDVLLPWTEYGPCRPVISNCIFAGNSADYGGAVYCYSDGPLSHTEPLLVHCTFVDNQADLEGGGLYSWMSEPTVKNCIFWKNIAGTLFPEIRNVTNSSWITFSDVRGGYPGKGNIEQDPRFIGEQDYHLMPGSPCIDRGTDAGVGRDIDGDARPLLKGFDMGADEYSGPCWDADSDGHADQACGGDDCDDANANIFPGNPNPFCNCLDPYPGGTNEISGDGVDNNCNGLVDEWD